MRQMNKLKLMLYLSILFINCFQSTMSNIKYENQINIKLILENFNKLEHEFYKSNNENLKLKILDSLNNHWSLICSNKKKIIEYIKTQFNDSHNLTNVKIKINDSFSPYIKGFYYYGLSNYYKDSFYSIFLIESILRGDYLFFHKPITSNKKHFRTNVYIVLNKYKLIKNLDYTNVIYDKKIMNESIKNLITLIERLKLNKTDVLIENKSLLTNNDSLFWYSKNYNLKQKIDLNDSINKVYYKLPKSLKNIRIDCY